MTKENTMNEPGTQAVFQQLMDNVAEIIDASTEAGPERLIALARGQRDLARALEGRVPQLGAGDSRVWLEELQGFVMKAVEAVRTEMALNRDSMQTTGVKKKVLRAYGTVTFSTAP